MTPLGATGSTPEAVARRIVNYLEGAQPSAAQQLLGRPDAAAGIGGAARYFSDSMEGSGRWLGRGAAELNLVGDIDPEQFEHVLAGRHPVTGQRLVSAQGSARRRHLAVGTAALTDGTGEPLYDLGDVATIIGRPRREVELMAERGDTESNRRPELADWLVATVGVTVRRLVAANEVQRWLDLTVTGVTAVAVRASGPPGDALTTAEASRLTGLSPQYLRRVAKRYLEHQARHRTGEPDGEWLACRPARRGPRPSYRIRRADLAAFIDRRRPPAVRCGFDLTLTTEKSFAVLMMLSTPERRETFERVLNAANQVAIDHLEDHAAFTRHKGQRVGTTGLTVASYLHGTSRALDPFPHRHNIVANTALDAHGERKTLDARAFYREAPVAAALATAEMRWQLTTQLGVTWRRSPRGVWEIDGVPDAVLDEFSQRRDAIEAAVTELERILGRPITKNQVQDVVLDTRDAKQPTTVGELLAQWNDRSARHGFGPEAINSCFRGSTMPPWDPETEASVLDQLTGPQGMTENVNWFTHGDVIRALVDLEVDTGGREPQPILLPPAEIEALAVRVLADPRIVELLPGVAGDRIVGPNGRVESVFTTIELLEVQERIRDRFAVGLHARMAVVPPEPLDLALAVGPTLDDSQRCMVRSLCTSGAQIQAAIGPPGSGKTATMATAAAAWQNAGYTVVGAAVKGEAARLLAEAAGIETNTLAWYLAHDDPHRHPFDSRTVVVVDEASTISDRDLDRLIAVAATTGCAIRLIGDPAQHGSVGAGGSFRSLTVTHPENTPALTGNRRLHNATERATADLVRAGQIPAALALMSQTGRLVETGSEVAAQVAVIERWWQHRQSGDRHPMVDRVNTTRRTLNTLAHQLRVTAGEVHPTGLRSAAGLEFNVGDDVIAKAPARHLHAPTDPSRYVRNGSLGVVTAVEPDGLVIDFDGIGPITMPAADVDGPAGRPGLDYAYAVTSYAVQGATFERSTSVITPASSQAELYVDITRGRHENVAIAVQPAPDDPGEAHLPRLPAPALRDAVAAGVRAKPGDQAVTEMDPLALAAARIRGVRALASLHAERRGLARDASGQRATVLERAEMMAAGAVDRAARTRPPPDVAVLLGPRPDNPWQAREWDEAVASIAVFEARWLRSWRANPLTQQAADHDRVASRVGAVRAHSPQRAALKRAPARHTEASRSL